MTINLVNDTNAEKQNWYIQCPSGRRIYGNPLLLRFGLDWVNILGLIIVVIGGIIIFNYLL